MKQFIPLPSHTSIRVFNACLLSFLLLITPLATLAASMNPVVLRTVESTDARPQPTDAARPEPAAAPESEAKAEDLQHSSKGLFSMLAQPLPPSITATKTDAFTDANADGKADIGQTINYEAVISNIAGTSSATGVVFTDAVDTNTTLTGTVNTSPIALDQSVVLNEDTPTAITLTGIDPDNNSLTYTVVGNPTNGGLTGTAPNLTYTPNADFNGSDTITFKVNDGTVDSNQLGTISITITSVNDAPTFTQSGGNQTVLEDSGLNTVPGFITAISPGPANEAAQTVSFVITNNSNPGLFAGGGAPAISSTGTLTYTTAANENGTATITYKAQDNGGTANGGDDDSPTQTFDITINAVNDPPVAAAKAFTAQANMRINLTGLLTGATDPNDTVGDQDVGYTPTFTLTSITPVSCSPACTPAQLATIVATNLNNTNNGSFDFDAPPGHVGTVTLNYTVTDSGNPAPGVQSAPQTITITVNGPVVWFVNPNAASNGDGRLLTPFKFLSNNAGANNDADDVDAASHRIFLYTGAATGGFTLNADEWLVGQGATNSPGTFDDLMGFVPPTGTYPRPSIGGTRPTITSASSGVTLGSNNRLFGLSFTDTAGTAINGSAINVGTLLLKDIDIVNDISASGAGLFLSGGGTVTLTGTNNFINTTSAIALFVANTNIGAANLNFVSIKAGNNNAFPDPTNGINLTSTGASGGLIVTGNSAGQCGGNVNTATSPFTITVPNTADCTGGEIQGTTGAGIILSGTRNVSLTRMWIHNTGLSGIDGTTTTNFTFDRGLIEKSGLNDALTPVTALADVSNIAFNDVSSGVNNLSGTVTITRSTLRNAFYHGIDIYNEDGTISDLIIGGSGAGNAITSTTSTASSKGSGIKVRANGAGSSASVVTKATIAHNSVLNYPSDSGIKVLGGNAALGPQSVLGSPGSATDIISITNNDSRGPNSATPMGSNAIETAMTGTGRAKFSITNNGTATTPLQHFKGIGITSSGGNRAQLVAIINNNFIDAGDNIFSSRGMAVGAQVGYPSDTTSNGTVNISVTNNTVNNSAGQGIFAAITNSNISGNILIQNNTVGGIRDAGTPAIRVESGSSSGNTNLCLNLSSNNATGNAAPGIGVRKQGTVATTNVFGIVGLAPSPATANQTEDYLGTQNPGSNLGPVGFSNDGTRSVRAIVHSGSNFVSCSQPAISSIQNQFEVRDVLAELDNAIRNGDLNSLFAPAQTASDYASVSDELNGIRQAVPALPKTARLLPVQVTAKALSTTEQEVSNTIASFADHTALTTNGESSNSSDIATAAAQTPYEEHAPAVVNTDSSLHQASFVKASDTPSADRKAALARAETNDKYTNLSHARTVRAKQPAAKASATASAALAPLPPGTVRVDGSGNETGSGFTLPAGKSVTVRFSVTVNSPLPAGVTQVSNQGQVEGTNFSTVLTDDPSVVGASNPTVTPIARADLALTSKTDGVTTINPGQDLTYTINYANNGRAASNAVITETVPVGTVFKAAGSSAGWSCGDGSAAGTTCTLTIGAVPSTGGGSTGSRTFVVTVVSPAAAGLNTISNTASIADTVVYEPDITPADNSATDNNTAVNAVPDLRIVDKSDGVAMTTPGSTLTYTISYENTGTQNATGVVLTETVPVGTTFEATGSSVWTGCADGAAAGTVCTITVGSLSAGAAPASVTFAVNVDSTIAAGQTHINNTVSIDDDHANGGDPTANNSQVDSDVLNAAPDLTISKTPDVSTIAPGQPIIYTLDYANVGTQGATNVVITETVPASTTFETTGSTGGWSCPDGSVAGTTCTLAIGTVGAGTNGQATFAVTVVDPVPGGTTQVSNTATIADDGTNGADANSGDNTGTANIGVCLNPAVVTNSSDSGAGSLRQALIDVCDGGTITFQAGVTTVNLTSGELVVDKNVTITGNGASATTVHRTSGTFRIFNINPGTVVNISNLTISDGQAPHGADNGAGPGAPGEAGGGIFNEGTLTLTNVVVTGNKAGNGGAGTGDFGGNGGLGGGIASGPGATLNIESSTISNNQSGTGGAGAPAGFGGNGGGIYSLSDLTINNSLFTGNQALGLGAEGGAIDSEFGTLIINNSTISGNTADGPGGGLLNCGSTTATLTNVTITNNRADNDNDAQGAGGGIGQVSANPITLHNTIVAGNFNGASPSTTPDDIDGAMDPASSYNLIGTGGSGGLTGVNNNQVNVADAGLAPLANNGGPTQTHALLTGSPALDAGDNSVMGAPLNFTTDQRGSGFGRQRDAADLDTVQTVDIGAFEADPSVEDISDKTTAEDTPLPQFSFNVGDGSTAFDSITAVATSNPTLVATITVGPGADASKRTLDITPASNQSGTATITVTVTKTVGGTPISVTDTFLFNVTDTNDAPTITDDAISGVAEDSGTYTIPIASLIANDSPGPVDENGQTLVLTAVSNPVGGTVAINGTNVEFTPTADFNGPASFQYTVTDDGTPPQTSAAGNVTFTITEVNDAPTASNDSLSSSAEDSGVRVIPFADLTGNDSTGPADEAGQSLIVKTVSNPVGGTVAINGSNVEFTPTADFNGAASFDYTIEDNGTTNGAADPITSSGSATASFTITEVNDAPTASNDALSNVLEDSGVRTIPFADLTGNDSAGPANEAGQTLVVKTVSNPVGGTVAINGTNVEFTPTANFNGAASFDYTVEDNGTTNAGADPLESAAAATVSFAIDPVNDAPSFTKGADQIASGNNPQTITNWATNILAGPPDEAGQTVMFNITNNTNAALFSTQPSIDPSGTLTFTPIAGVNGTATITVELKDNGGVLNGGVDTSAPQTFNITISPTGWTTTADSGATEDESNPARPTYTNFTASPISGTPAGTYVLRYNITAMGNLTSLGAANTRLRVRFRDEGDGSRVTVAIIQSPITGGATTIGTILDSDTYLPGSGFQTQEILMPALVFDFSQNTYWLEVTMTKTNSANQPGLGSVQINQQ